MLKQINDGIFNTKHIVKFYFKNNTNLVISDINNSETTITFKRPINNTRYFMDLLNFQMQDKRVQAVDFQSILDELEESEDYEDSDNLEDFKGVIKMYYLKLCDEGKILRHVPFIIRHKNDKTGEVIHKDFNLNVINEKIFLNDLIKFNDDRVYWRVCYRFKNNSEVFVVKERLNRKEIFERFNIDDSLFDTGLIEFFNTKDYDFIKILIESGFILY